MKFNCAEIIKRAAKKVQTKPWGQKYFHEQQKSYHKARYLDFVPSLYKLALIFYIWVPVNIVRQR